MTKYKTGFELVVLCDAHYGNPTFQEQFFEECIQYIKNGGNRYWIYLGDGIENNLKGSVGSVYNQSLNPMEQMDGFIDYLKPIKHKCVAWNLHSNHSARTYKEVGINPDELMAQKLGIKQKLWSPAVGQLDISVNDNPFTIIHTHGSAGASTMGGKLNAFSKLQNNYHGNIYLMAHMHSLFQWKDYTIRDNKYEERINMIGGSFIDYFHGYGQQKMYSPLPASFGSITIDKYGKVGFENFICEEPIIKGYRY
jgi:hypothetical protein